MGLLDDAIKAHLDLKRKHGAPEEELQRQEEEALGPPRREVAQQREDAEGEAVAAGAEGGTATAIEPEEGDAARSEPDTGAALFDAESAAGDPAPSDAPTEFMQAAATEPASEESIVGAQPQAPEAAPQSAEAPSHEPPVDQQSSEAEPPAVAAPLESPSPRDPQEREAASPPQAQPGAAEDPPTPAGDTPPSGFEPAPDERADSGTTQEYDPFAPEHAPPARDDATAAEADEHDADDLFADEGGEAESEGPSDADVLEDTPDFLQETPEHDRLWFEQKPPRDFDFD